MLVQGCEECETRLNCSRHSPIMRRAVEARQLANVAYNFGYDEGQALGLYRRGHGKDSDTFAKRAVCPATLAGYEVQFRRGFAAGQASAFED